MRNLGTIDTHFAGKKINAGRRIGNEGAILTYGQTFHPHAVHTRRSFVPDAQSRTGSTIGQTGDDIGPACERQNDIDTACPELTYDPEQPAYPVRSAHNPHGTLRTPKT